MHASQSPYHPVGGQQKANRRSLHNLLLHYWTSTLLNLALRAPQSPAEQVHYYTPTTIKLSNGELTAKGLAMTRMMCANPQLNELDNTISEMLKEGAQVDLTANQLTLATAKQTLTYKLADLMN